MLVFSIDNRFVMVGGHVFQQTVGILMDINCAPLLADLFLYSHEADFLPFRWSWTRGYFCNWLGSWCSNKVFSAYSLVDIFFHLSIFFFCPSIYGLLVSSNSSYYQWVDVNDGHFVPEDIIHPVAIEFMNLRRSTRKLTRTSPSMERSEQDDAICQDKTNSSYIQNSDAHSI